VKIVVREPEAADLNRLAAINVTAWRSAYAGIVPSSYLDAMDFRVYRERWANRSTLTTGHVSYVGEFDGLVTTYGVAGRYRPQEDAAPENGTGWG
jgi:hypothetical protein